MGASVVCWDVLFLLVSAYANLGGLPNSVQHVAVSSRYPPMVLFVSLKVFSGLCSSSGSSDVVRALCVLSLNMCMHCNPSLSSWVPLVQSHKGWSFRFFSHDQASVGTQSLARLLPILDLIPWQLFCPSMFSSVPLTVLGVSNSPSSHTVLVIPSRIPSSSSLCHMCRIESKWDYGNFPSFWDSSTSSWKVHAVSCPP